MENKVWVEVVYALPEKQWGYRLHVPRGETVAQVIQASGVLQQCPELQLEQLKVGVWGHLVPLTYQVEVDDRIEIYRPLLVDPKQVRHNKVLQERRNESVRRNQPKVQKHK